MKYMIRETFTTQRGKVPEYMEDLKIIIDLLKSLGYSHHRVYVDISGRMDTVYHEYEVDSLDQYFQTERGFFVDMDEQTKGLVNHYNNITLEGTRAIFEVII